MQQSLDLIKYNFPWIYATKTICHFLKKKSRKNADPNNLDFYRP